VDRSYEPEILERTLSDGSKTFTANLTHQLRFTPSGEYNGCAIIVGQLSFLSEDEKVFWRFNQYFNKIKKIFSKTRVYWIGPDALKLFDSGMRFTHATQMPEAYNLARPRKG